MLLNFDAKKHQQNENAGSPVPQYNNVVNFKSSEQQTQEQEKQAREKAIQNISARAKKLNW